MSFFYLLIMNRGNNVSIAQRYLSKNKKYYSYKTIKKDKENIMEGDINSIIEKLSCEKKLKQSAIMKHKRRDPTNLLQVISPRKSVQRSKFSVNSMHFFEHDQHKIMMKTDLKKQINYYINKIRQPIRSKCSLYQEYILLSQQTNDYLEYYLTNFTGQDSGCAAELLKGQGKTIILLILKKYYKFFETNSTDITNRIFLSFNLNPLNEFQFITWQKFMKMRKLISGDFSRKDYSDFIVKYFISEPKKSLKGNDFWLIFSSVIRKLSLILDSSHLEILLNKLKDSMNELLEPNELITSQKLQKMIQEEPLFIWHEFVTLIFL